MNKQVKYVNCATCDIACQLKAIPTKDGKYNLEGDLESPLSPGAICAKGKLAHEIFDHPNRITKPLKLVGERGSGEYIEINWQQALDEIAEKLTSLVNKYGPETLAVSSGPWNVSTESGMTRRFMNLLGSPNYIGPVALCMGNTAAVNRLTYGWFPYPDIDHTECIVLFGHNPNRNSWVWEYIRYQLAEQRGAKLIVLDPRSSQSAERADIHLALKPGTDAAMCLGWINVIITEKLYDKKFVKNWTHGFDELKEYVQKHYSLKRVSEITGVSEKLIQQAARMYAKATSAVIPWGQITDQQHTSTSAIRGQAILRAITGNLDIAGGEMLLGLSEQLISESELELHETLSSEQKEKQLGYHKHPVFTYKSAEKLSSYAKKVWGLEYPNIIKGGCMANPSLLFRAMAYEKPYPVKAFISIANNTLLSYANQALMQEAFMNQELVVSHEQFMTPTARLSDYILPSDTWMERPNIHDSFEWTSVLQVSEPLYQPPEECKNIYNFWHDLAHRMNLGEHFPWKSLEELFDHRLRKSGHSYESFKQQNRIHIPDVKFKKYEQTGFATPTGKVELFSTILDEYDFSPFPYHRDSPKNSDQYPINLFVGIREPNFFQSGQRHVKSLRKSMKEPLVFVSENTADRFQLIEGQEAKISSITGHIFMTVKIRNDMPDDLIRIPHGWWKPEKDSGAPFLHNDAVVVPDSEDYLDREQGIPHLKSIPCNIVMTEK